MTRTEQALLRAIERSGLSRHRIAQDTGVTAGHLSRFVNGKTGLSVEVLDRLADYLRLEIILQPKPIRKAR